jgi:hypothetical protein
MKYAIYCIREISALVLTGAILGMIVTITGVGIKSTPEGVEPTLTLYVLAAPAYFLAACVVVGGLGFAKFLFRGAALLLRNTSLR